MAKLFNDSRIYFKDSDRVRLADYRARIVRESNPRRPDEHEDLVFVSDKKETYVPENVLMSYGVMFPDGTHETFFTTAERCREMVSDDPSYWTKEKLEYFANVEKKLWKQYLANEVYGYVIEKWDENRREWVTTTSLWGMYGPEALLENLASETDGVNIPICINEEDMKYEFDNCEKTINEFS
jgi:hypothetical protein